MDIDFETYSEVDPTKVGLDNYISHDSTDIICMAYSVDGGNIKLWTPGGDHSIPSRYTLVAHNAQFEYGILTRFSSRYGLPMPTYTRCTAAKAACMTLPRSLEGASKALKLSKTKDLEGRRVMLQVTKPRKPSKHNPDTNWFGDEEKMATVYEYCMKDVEVEMAIDQATYPIRPRWEEEIWEMDSVINSTGIPVDIKLVEKAIATADRYVEILNKRMSDLTEGKVPKVTATAKLKTYLMEDLDFEVDSLSKDILEELLARDLPYNVRQVLELRKEGSLTSIAKYKKIDAWVSRDGNLRNLFMYFGAGTGRWTGKGPQLHNLPRGQYKGDKEVLIQAIYEEDIDAISELADLEGLNAMDLISSCIREVFCAPKRHTFIAGDYSGIEVRVLAWLSGQKNLVELLRRGEDPYIDMASSIYHVVPANVTPEQRSIGKMAVLGLGYGMGADKFVEQCRKSGITIDLQFAREIVKTYRAKYRGVTTFWKEIEASMSEAIRIGESTLGPLVFRQDTRKNVVVTLPSGRPIYYIDCKMVPGRFGKFQPSHYKVDSYTNQWCRRETYGGMLTENVVQAIARDILAQAMLRLHRIGLTPVLHVHDEAVILVKELEAVRLEEKFSKALLTREEWSKDIPLDVETWIGRRYHK